MTWLPVLFMRKKCNAIGQERTVMSEAAPTWRKGAVTCQGDIAAFTHIIRMHKTEIKDVQKQRFTKEKSGLSLLKAF